MKGLKSMGLTEAVFDIIAQFFAGLGSGKLTKMKKEEDRKHKTKK